MNWIKRIYPFNAEQTVNIASEFGPLVLMFIVNATHGIIPRHLGTHSLDRSGDDNDVAGLATPAGFPSHRKHGDNSIWDHDADHWGSDVDSDQGHNIQRNVRNILVCWAMGWKEFLPVYLRDNLPLY